MTSRFLAVLACSLGLAFACGGDDGEAAPSPEDSAGAPADAGAPPSSQAGSGSTLGGSGGTGGTGGGGTDGGRGGTGAVGGGGATSGGSAGETSMAGTSGEAGTPNEPSQPGGSACGLGKFESGAGCVACPMLPAQSSTTLSCQSYSSAEEMDEDLRLGFDAVTFHEALGGEVSVSWRDSTMSVPDGEAVVPWTYSPVDRRFFFDLPTEARYADGWTLTGWSFTDACGFLFKAPSLDIEYDGTQYRCIDPK